MSGALDLELAQSVSRATELIRDRLADAQAYALIGQISTAHRRLDELFWGLLTEMKDARAGAYLRAFAAHSDPTVHDPAIGPEPEAAERARTVPIMGRTPLDVKAVLRAARQDLPTSAAVEGDERTAALAGWKARHVEAISQYVRGAMSNDQMALHEAVRVIKTRAELR